mmetsp:Transcript_78586/g.163289  ORF Transcript_78586/g.163289 Transcript_78586/m.163289 type:complete len:627 (-) Transcript_78586:60-1940(-)
MAAAALHHHVPNYDISGSQHPHRPFKDKGHLKDTEIRHHKWLDGAPPVKSLTDLRQSRNIARVPDLSYDLDGDGCVGSMDLFLGRRFDKDRDGHLQPSERSRALKASKSESYMGQFVTGLEASGKDGHRVMQMHGEILDAAQNAANNYGPHHNSHIYPPHYTNTALKMSRKAELKAKAWDVGQRYAERCAPIDEPQPPTHLTKPRECPIQWIWQRGEPEHQAARVKAGLAPAPHPLNPERELKEVGRGHVHEPAFKTRTELLEKRREANTRHCEELRIRGEETCVDHDARKAAKEEADFEFRRPKVTPRTLTQMNLDRRQEKIQYDVQNFPLPTVYPREYPKFENHPDVPFWKLGQPSPEHKPAVSRTISAPIYKVTDTKFDHALTHDVVQQIPEAAHTLAMAGKSSGLEKGQEVLGSHTVKRWSAEMIERGAGRNKPRLFDSIPVASIGPKDWEPLDLTSSMEPIRVAALRRQAEERKNAWMRRSTMSKLSPSQEDSAFGNETTLSNGGSRRRNVSSASAMDLKSGGMNRTSLSRRSRANSQAVPYFGIDNTTSVMGEATWLDQTAEPRFFGTTASMAKPASETSVRCGGFVQTTAPKAPPVEAAAAVAASSAASSPSRRKTVVR